MSTVLDIVGSVVLFGILILTVARVQGNMNTSLYESSFNLQTQRNAVELARQIEFDFTKIGYRVPEGRQLFYADSTTIIFQSDLLNNHTIDSIRYSIGTGDEIAASSNTRIVPLKRYNKLRGEIVQNFGITRFQLAYYDSSNRRLTTPITLADTLAKIRSINVSFRVESFEPVITESDTTWFAVNWEKLIYPRNLNNLR